jgi:hypothetical protein
MNSTDEKVFKFEPTYPAGFDEKSDSLITFRVGADKNAVEILRLDRSGMTYKGKRIEDAGEAHKAFLEAMACMKRNAESF